MKVDVSEIKTFKTCKRQWELTSRNKMHLRPIVTPKQFSLGTLFHESLHSLYLGVSLEKVMEMVKKEMTEDDRALLAMVPGYAKNVLSEDLDHMIVLDIEHRFSFRPCTPDGEMIDEDLEVTGSIDMVVLDTNDNKIYGFEHKTCKSFRDSSFMWMDEQPRVYTEALKQYVTKYNERKRDEWYDACCKVPCIPVEHGGPEIYPEEPVDVQFGGVYINEVKKLLRDFQYNRTLCVYPEGDMENFMQAFFGACCACKQSVDSGGFCSPSPSYFNCQMCSFKGVCETYMYSALDESQLLQEFADEFHKRREDHLDEKVERKVE